MPTSNYTAIPRLKRAYDTMPWYQKLFFPRKLAFELSNLPEVTLFGEMHMTNVQAFSVFNAFENNGLIQRWFFSCLRRFDGNHYTQALRNVKSSGFLTGDRAQANFDAIVAHHYAEEPAEAFEILKTEGFLTGDRAQANFAAVVGHRDSIHVALGLRILKAQGLLTGERAQVNFDAVATHLFPDSVLDALIFLRNAGLLRGDRAQANFDTLVTHPFLASVINLLLILSNAGLLTVDGAQANFNAVVANVHLGGFIDAIRVLNTAGLLTGAAGQANFDAVAITYAAVLFHNHEFWAVFPVGRPTAAEFQVILNIAQQHVQDPTTGQRAFRAYVATNILGINVQQQAAAQPGFNLRQSTHTASVHASVSESAIHLFDLYHDKITARALDTIINELSSWVHAYQPKDNKQRAASRCINRITRQDYFYTDTVSHVSTRQLLALVWLGIHDNEARKGELRDAEQQLLEGLYEIQCGDNLSEAGVDNGGVDLPICLAGTFNKLIEKLAGIHPQVTVRFITKEGASLKLPIVVKEEANKYLLEDASEELKELQDSMINDDMEPLWAIISPFVATRMFDDFGSLYPNGKNSPEFTDLIQQGIYALDKDQLLTPAPSPASSRSAFFAQGRDDGAVPPTRFEARP